MKTKISSKTIIASMIITIILFSLVLVAIPISVPSIAEATVPPATSLTNDGIYYLRNQRSGKYLDVSGNYETNGTNVMQYTYTGNDNQRFKLYNISADVYEIIPMHAQNMRIDINGASTENNANVQIYESNSTNAQRFKIQPTGNNDGAYKILTANTNYQKCITVEGASYDDANVIQYGYGNNGTQDNDHWYFEDVTLNEKIKVMLVAGTKKTYHITIPDDKFYVIETSKKTYDHDTTLSVSGLTSGTLYDDNSGEGSFSQICFSGQAGRDLTILVGFANLTVGGTFYLQIRRQQAVLYGGEYPDLDTTMDPYLPNIYLSPYYASNKFIDESSNHFLSQDSRGYARYNSEIMFFSGHGNSTSVRFSDNSYVYMSNLTDMSNVRVAVWSSCKSGLIDSASNSSMVHKSVDVGANCAIGFDDTVSQLSAYTFTSYLFEYLANGSTITQAAHDAVLTLVFWDKCRDYVIVGDGTTTISTPTYTKGACASKYSAEECQQIHNLLKTNKNYQAVDIKDWTRYYLLVNGYISNHYIDIMYDDNGQVSNVLGDVDELYNRYVPLNVLPILITHKPSTNASHVQTVYVEQNGTYIPVVIENIERISNDNLPYCEVVCTNLNDGSEVPYESFCSKRIL